MPRTYLLIIGLLTIQACSRDNRCDIDSPPHQKLLIEALQKRILEKDYYTHFPNDLETWKETGESYSERKKGIGIVYLEGTEMYTNLHRAAKENGEKIVPIKQLHLSSFPDTLMGLDIHIRSHEKYKRQRNLQGMGEDSLVLESYLSPVGLYWPILSSTIEGCFYKVLLQVNGVMKIITFELNEEGEWMMTPQESDQ